MNEETVEFGCTDCGATVPADAKSCPKCGVSFEESPRQEEIEYTCSECGGSVDLREKACPNYGASLYIQYYSVSSGKLALLSICSLGLYQLYWFYENWYLIKEQEGKKILPFVRAIFPFFFCHQLFKRILVSAQSLGYQRKYSPWFLTIAFIVITLFFQLSPNPLWLIGYLGFVPLLPVQRAINFNNSKVNPDFVENDKFSIGQVILVIIGGTILLFGVISTISRT